MKKVVWQAELRYEWNEKNRWKFLLRLGLLFVTTDDDEKDKWEEAEKNDPSLNERSCGRSSVDILCERCGENFHSSRPKNNHKTFHPKHRYSMNLRMRWKTITLVHILRRWDLRRKLATLNDLNWQRMVNYFSFKSLKKILLSFGSLKTSLFDTL